MRFGDRGEETIPTWRQEVRLHHIIVEIVGIRYLMLKNIFGHAKLTGCLQTRVVSVFSSNSWQESEQAISPEMWNTLSVQSFCHHDILLSILKLDMMEQQNINYSSGHEWKRLKDSWVLIKAAACLMTQRRRLVFPRRPHIWSRRAWISFRKVNSFTLVKYWSAEDAKGWSKSLAFILWGSWHFNAMSLRYFSLAWIGAPSDWFCHQ